MSIWMGAKHRHHYKKMFKGHLPVLVTAAGIGALANILFLTGLEETFVSYAIAIKRATLIIGSIVLGSVVFKEHNIKYRITGALIMVIGIVFVLVLH